MNPLVFPPNITTFFSNNSFSINSTLDSNSTIILNSTDQTNFTISSIENVENFRVPGVEIVTRLGVTLVNLSAICTTYVLFRALRMWWHTRVSLPRAWRIPFYIAISEFFLWTVHLPNLIYPILHGRPWPEKQCKIIGGVTFFFIASNILLVGLIAISTYCRIVRKIRVEFGRYDYKLFATILILSLTLTIIGIPSFGSSKYWCYTNKVKPIMPILTLVLNFTILLATFFCYASTYNEINSVKVKVDESSDEFSIRAKIENIVTRKIITYVLIFLIQWTPSMIYVVGQIINYDPIWAYIVTDLTINVGGMANFVQFVINEGWCSEDHNILYPPRRNSQIQPELGNGSTFTISMTEMSAAVIHVRHSDLSSNFYDIDMSQGESDVDYKE